MNNTDRRLLGRMEAKIDDMHEDIKDIRSWNASIQKNLNKLTTETVLNTEWREEHQAEHRGYFGKAIAILGVLVGIFTIGWNIIINFINFMLRR